MTFESIRKLGTFMRHVKSFNLVNNPLRTELETLKILAKQIKASLMKVGMRDLPFTETTFGERDFA